MPSTARSNRCAGASTWYDAISTERSRRGSASRWRAIPIGPVCPSTSNACLRDSPRFTAIGGSAAIKPPPAAFPGIESEERGVAEAIAVNLREMMMLDTGIVVIVSGEGGSGGALGIAVGDSVMMQEYAIYSVIPPEGCAAILWRDPAKKVEAAEALKLTAPDLLRAGIVDEIVPE